MTAGLDSILRQTTETRPRPQHVHVTVDRADGTVVRKEGLLGRMVQSLRRTVTYDLTIDTWADIYDVDRITRIFVTKEEAKIRFRLRVIARASRAEQIVQALADLVRPPSEVLFDVVGDAIRHLSDESQREGPDGLARRIARDRTNWQRRIEQSILDRIGLEAEIVFELGPDIREYPEIAVRHLDVRLADTPDSMVSATVHVVLEPTEERAHDPLPTSEREREERVRRIVATTFRDEVMLYDFWFEPRKVEQILSQALDRAFRTAAHRTRKVQLEPVSPTWPREEKIACNIPWRGNAGRVIDFYVDAMLSFLPNGAGLFLRQHLTSREDWLRQQATRALEIAMHGRDFWDLALADQAEVGARVESLLRVAANETGQKIDPIVAKVILPENRWLDKQYLEVTGQKYKTKNELGVAEFDVYVEIQFKTIRRLVDFVRQNRDQPRDADDFNREIEAGIREMVRKTAALTMSQIEHSDYFARWEQWDHVGEVLPGTMRGETNYVHNRLVLAIQSELRSRFDPTLCVVRLRKIDSAVAEIWHILNELGALSVDVSVTPKVFSSRGQMIPVKIRFRPGELDPERIPQVVARGKAHLDRAAILATLASTSRQCLNDLDAAEIRSLDKGLAAGYGDDRKALKTRLEEYVSRQMVETYGFTIRVEDGAVGFTAEENAGLDTAHLATAAAQALATHRLEQIAAELARARATRADNDALVAQLTAAMRANPRQTQEDRNRYELDAGELAEAKKRLLEDDRRIDGLVDASAGAARALVLPPSAAGSEPPRPEPEATVVDVDPIDLDDEPDAPSTDPSRPTRL